VWGRSQQKKIFDKKGFCGSYSDLGTSGIPNGEGKEPGGGDTSVELEVSERSGVTLDGLRDSAFLGIELDGTDNPSLLFMKRGEGRQ